MTSEISIKKNIFHTFLLCLITSLLFNSLSYEGGIISTIVVCLYFLFIDDVNKYILLVMFLPFAAVFKVSANFPSSMLLLYLLFLCSNFKFKVDVEKIILFLLIVIHQIANIYFWNLNAATLASYAVNVLISGVLLNKLTNETESNRTIIFNFVTIAFALSLMLESVMAFLFPEIKYMLSFNTATALEFQNRFSALNVDPNYYAQLVSVSVALLVPLLAKRKNILLKGKIFFMFAIIFLSYCGYISYSKNYVISLSVMIVIIVVASNIRNKYQFRELFWGVILLFLSVALADYFFDNVVMNVFVQRGNSAGLLTGRDSIWKDYLSLFENNPATWIWGMGPSNGANVINSHAAAHNTFVEIIGNLGIVGVVFIFFYYKVNGLACKLHIFDLEYLYIIMFIVSSLSLSISGHDFVFLLIPLWGCTMMKNRTFCNIR